MTEASFIETNEHRRFLEFCDACRRYRYIGLCYGPPGVGKTLSARHYAKWDKVEACVPYRSTERGMRAAKGADTILYTPGVVNPPGKVAREIGDLRRKLYDIAVANVYREEDPLLERAQRRLDKERKRVLTEYDWSNGPPKPLVRAQEKLTEAISKRTRATRKAQDPTTLILIDEADRLKMSGLEQARDVFDRGDLGLVLIGMPGLEKRLARYPQLYSRVGFVHQFRPLSEAETRRVLQLNWNPDGIPSLESSGPNEEAVAAIIRVTGGNFRLIQRLLIQIARVMGINNVSEVTVPVVEAARESLVIGIA